MPVQILTTQDMDYELIPEGVYSTIVTKITEKDQFNRFSNEQETGFNIEFTIQNEGEFKGKPAYKFFTPFLTANSHLTALCRAVMGRGFTVDELAAITGLATLQPHILNQSVTLLIKNRKSGTTGKTYYNISDFLNAQGVPTTTPSPAPTQPMKKVDISAPPVVPPATPIPASMQTPPTPSVAPSVVTPTEPTGPVPVPNLVPAPTPAPVKPAEAQPSEAPVIAPVVTPAPPANPSPPKKKVKKS